MKLLILVCGIALLVGCKSHTEVKPAKKMLWQESTPYVDSPQTLRTIELHYYDEPAR